MNDFIVHMLLSFMIAFFTGAFTRNLRAAIAITLLLGIGKEFFIDISISPFDLCADFVGMFIAYDILKKDLRRSYN